MSKGKILFIDDDNFLRKVYETELKEKGYEVYLAIDGENGLQKINEVKPDLIILDLIMPKKSGFEVLSELSQFEETRNVPVIVLSNLAQSDDQKRALDLGAVDYMVKDNTTLDLIAEKIDYYLHAVRKPKSPLITKADIAAKTLSPDLQEKKGKDASSKQEAGPLGSTEPHGRNFCWNCGYKLKKGAKFCPDCGQAQ